MTTIDPSRKYLLYYLAALVVGLSFWVAGWALGQQPPAAPSARPVYESQPVFPVLDWAVPHYPGRPIRNYLRVYWFGLQPLPAQEVGP